LTVVFVILTGVIFRAGSVGSCLAYFPRLAVPPKLGRGLTPIVLVPLVAFLLPASQDIIERLTRRPRPWLAALVGIGLLALLNSENAMPVGLLTSTSDQSDQWGRCLAACLGALVIGAVLLFAVMIAVDPYDTGKFGWLGIDGVDDRDTHTATASRARDPQFDSVVIGNSTAQMLNPAELSQATGLRFVQLYLTGGSPGEQLAVLDFFLRNHQRVAALAIVADPFWCSHEHIKTPPGRFPFWLYDNNSLAYAARFLSWPAIEHLSQGISIGLGWRKRNEPNGYFSYEDIWHPGVFREVNRPRDPVPAATAAGRAVFPEISLLDAAVKQLPASVSVVLVVPPTFHTTIAQPGTAAAAEREACNAALQRVVAGRPHSNFINYRIDNALTRDPANFADFIHYRPIIAGKMAQGIADSIKLGEAAKIDF